MRTAFVTLAVALMLMPASSPAIPDAVTGAKLSGITFNASADNPVVFLVSFRLAIREGDDVTATGFFQCREHPKFHSPCPSSSRGTVTGGRFGFDFNTGLSNTTSTGLFFTRGARLQLPKCKGLSTFFCTPY